MELPKHLTSRSAYETYRRCPRKRYLGFHYNTYGLALDATSIPLATGSNIHRGVEYLLKEAQLGAHLHILQNEVVEDAIRLALDNYKLTLKEAGFTGAGTKTAYGAEFTLAEQSALVEALLRIWTIYELPLIMQQFQIIAVEQECLTQLTDDIGFQSKADAVLQKRDTKDVYAYSLKSLKALDWRTEEYYQEDLQGITESWAVDRELTKYNSYISRIEEMLDSNPFLPVHNVDNIKTYLNKKRPPNEVMGVRYCFLIKGKRFPDYRYKDAEGKAQLFYTASPLIRGYRRFSPSGVEYAHSYYFPNPNNPSGKGRLPKGFETFNVWEAEEVGYVKGWINRLLDKEIQPDCGDVTKLHCIVPPEFFRNSTETRRTIAQVTFTERVIFSRLAVIEESLSKGNTDEAEFYLDCYFPQDRQSCHFPTDCPFHPICFKPSVENDPIGSGIYVPRVPHHEPERYQHEILKKVSSEDD